MKTTLKSTLRDALQKKMGVTELDTAIWNKAWAKYVRFANGYSNPQCWFEEQGEEYVLRDLDQYYWECLNGKKNTMNRRWHAEGRGNGHCVGMVKK